MVVPPGRVQALETRKQVFEAFPENSSVKVFK